MNTMEDLENILLGTDSPEVFSLESNILEIDSIVSIFDIGLENVLADVEIMPLIEAYTKDGKFNLSDFAGFESNKVVDKIKEKYADIKKFISELWKSMINFFKRIRAMMSLSDMLIQKYCFALMDLNKKLKNKKCDRSPDEKDIKLGVYKGAVEMMAETYNRNLSPKFIKGRIDNLKSFHQKDLNNFDWKGMMASFRADIILFSGLERNSKSLGLNVINEIIEDKSIIKRFETLCKKCDYTVTDKYSFKSGKAHILKVFDDVFFDIYADEKNQKSLMDYIEAMEKIQKEFIDGKFDLMDVNKNLNLKDEMFIVSKTAAIIGQIQVGRTNYFKHVKGFLSALINDFKTLISIK